MKKLSLYISIFMMVALFSCDETEPVIFDPVNGRLALGFNQSSSTLAVPVDGVTTTIEVLSTTRSSVERSIPVSVDASSTADPADYTIGSIIIPAGEHVGSLEVTFDNFANMTDCVNNTLILNLESGTNDVNGSQQFTFNYTREFDCPDLFLNIEFDDYPGETSWQVAQGETILLTGDSYDGTPLSENLCLCPGTYTFTIFDAFGDGICCAYGEGSYEIVYNGNVLISGGEFGDSMTQDFTVD